MQTKNLLDLMSLLKVLDADFASAEDCRKVQSLNPNNREDVIDAVKKLMLPEFASYPDATQKRLLSLLHAALADGDEDFAKLFDRLQMIFDSEVNDKRVFMGSVLAGLETGPTV